MLQKNGEMMAADNVPSFVKEAKRLANLDVGSNRAICELAAKVKTSDIDSLGTFVVAHAVLLKAMEEHSAEVAHQERLMRYEQNLVRQRKTKDFFEGCFANAGYAISLFPVVYAIGAAGGVLLSVYNLINGNGFDAFMTPWVMGIFWPILIPLALLLGVDGAGALLLGVLGIYLAVFVFTCTILSLLGVRKNEDG